MQGINHITFAVSDLFRSLQFYTEILELKLVHQWDKGVYLLAGNMWIALNLDFNVSQRNTPDNTHIAFHLEKEKFVEFHQKLKEHNIPEWHENKSEGESIYFLDPDGHKLEVHYSNLQNRMDSIKKR